MNLTVAAASLVSRVGVAAIAGAATMKRGVGCSPSVPPPQRTSGSERPNGGRRVCAQSSGTTIRGGACNETHRRVLHGGRPVWSLADCGPGRRDHRGDEEVVFRVTLQGPVDPSHTFGVERHCAEEICVTEDIVIVCSPPDEDLRLADVLCDRIRVHVADPGGTDRRVRASSVDHARPPPCR